LAGDVTSVSSKVLVIAFARIVLSAPGEITQTKNPAVFRNILQAHIEAGEQRLSLLKKSSNG
jgi:hypothetical protein